MNFDIAKKDTTTFIAPGVVERKGDYIVCPECGHDRSFLLIENEPGKQIEWRCPECRKYLGGIIGETGTVERIAVEPARKWILIEIDADSEPFIVTAFRPQTIEEATRNTLDSEAPQQFSVPISFSLEECLPDAAINPKGFPQYRGGSKFLAGEQSQDDEG